jgi:hypothetical protein
LKWIDRAIALDASWYFKEGHMEVMIAMFDLAAVVAIVGLALVVPYLGYRVVRGMRVYSRFRGIRLVTCPETHKAAVVRVAASSMGMQAILDEPRLRLSECSRWPMREGCGQDCLTQIEARPSELRFSVAGRAS